MRRKWSWRNRAASPHYSSIVRLNSSNLELQGALSQSCLITLALSARIVLFANVLILIIMCNTLFRSCKAVMTNMCNNHLFFQIDIFWYQESFMLRADVMYSKLKIYIVGCLLWAAGWRDQNKCVNIHWLWGICTEGFALKHSLLSRHNVSTDNDTKVAGKDESIWHVLSRGS